MQVKYLRSAIMTLATALLLTGRALYAEGANPGDSSNAILDLLEKKGMISHEEANQARQDYAKQLKAAVIADDKMKTASWVDSMRWYGDFRLRGEYFDFEENPATHTKLNSNTDRLRFRLRLRLGTELKVQNWADIGARIGTGDSGDPYNGLSSNSTLTDTFRKKPLDLDLAYATIHPPSMDWASVTGGKMLVPIWHPLSLSPMVYDPDLTVEGVAEKVNFKFGEKQQFRVFGNFAQMAVKEFSADSDDAYLFDLQGGAEAKAGPIRVTVAAGYYLTTHLSAVTATPKPGSGAGAGTTPGNTSTADAANLGNSVGGTATNKYLGDFQVLSAMGEVAWTICDKPVLGTPAVFTVGGEYLKNVNSVYQHVSAFNVDDQTTAWGVQAMFGRNDKAGQWSLGYEYKRLEANATFDAITDDDFGTFGGTDRKGHVVNLAYCPFDWWQLNFRAFITDKIDSKRTAVHSQSGFAGQDSLRVQADTSFKF